MNTRSLRWPRTLALSAASLLILGFSGCEAASNLVFEPELTDPLDGYQGSLSQAGINTEMDWGPQQSLLLSEYKSLQEEHNKLRSEHEDTLAQNQNLLSKLDSERADFEREKSLRAQAQAETERLRSKSREYEATILDLSIEKANLEQERLLQEIKVLEATMNSIETEPVSAPAKPGRRP